MSDLDIPDYTGVGLNSSHCTLKGPWMSIPTFRFTSTDMANHFLVPLLLLHSLQLLKERVHVPPPEVLRTRAAYLLQFFQLLVSVLQHIFLFLLGQIPERHREEIVVICIRVTHFLIFVIICNLFSLTTHIPCQYYHHYSSTELSCLKSDNYPYLVTVTVHSHLPSHL